MSKHTPESLQSAIDRAYTLAESQAHDAIRLMLEPYVSAGLSERLKAERNTWNLETIKHGTDEEGS